ncbi:putative cleavage and polyadenylation specificity factor subunit 4-like protein [Spea bombifrons]|uniref:putative cleavage and polyadenylation specificity factor subunit 4-like protein n=1 Tax=Spea bombifrons TaxID=233779 RepID=UPI002349F536|nr:putative cleavage and polyadenylation specificity factor subunit 4-like protein [Spea bombifrons]
MQELIAGIEKFSFDFERDVQGQRGTLPLPFQGMDKSGAAVCDFFLKGVCRRGPMCPFRHLSGEKTVVCKHWLRGLCKKGDNCEFLHEYDMDRMPECYFYSKFGECSNKDCPFLHIDPASKIKDCPWYDRGFCKHGPACKHRHTRRVMCVNYLVGFCPEGPKCKYVHPKADLVLCASDHLKNLPQLQKHGELDVKPIAKQQPLMDLPHLSHLTVISMMHERFRKMQEVACCGLRPLGQVTCFKCGDRGHYANKCSKGRFAFLARK